MTYPLKQILTPAIAALAALCAMSHAASAQTAPNPDQPPYTVPPPEQRFKYGDTGWNFPPAIPLNRTPQRTVELLGQALAESSGTLRLRFIQEIGVCKLPQGAPLIKPFLADGDPLIRAQALHAAMLIGDASLLPDVQPHLKSDNDDVRREALLAFLELSSDDDARAAALDAALNDPTERIVITALRRALPANVNTIAGKLQGSSLAVQAEAIAALARLDATQHIGAIAACLERPLPVQTAAIQALAQLKATDHLPAIVALLNHRHPTIRRNALQAVDGLADVPEQQRHGLRMLQNDPDPTVRQAAATIFIEHPTIDAVADLFRQLDDPYMPLHNAAREALIVPNTPEMRQACIDAAGRLLYHENPRRIEDGSYILGRLKSDHEIDRHVELLAAAMDLQARVDAGVVTQAAWSLAAIGNRKATPPIVPLLRRAPHQAEMRNPIPFSTAEALFVAAAEFQLRDAVPEARRILFSGKREDQDPSMRAAAVYALHKLSDFSDENATRTLATLASSPPEGDNPRLEAVKGLAERRAVGQLNFLTTLATTDNSPIVRGAAHWARDMLAGEATPYTPPDAPWQAMVSIRDISKPK